MKLTEFSQSYAKEVVELFVNVFSISEGVDEGRAIGDLVTNLINTTSHKDLIGYVAISNSKVVASIFSVG